MSSINKLSIRGVRAFSPEDDEQVVEFFFPLTVITGANGCGKTTIIESLKYALSGSLPPAGTSRSAGQSFVHDPRSVDQAVVKANVKLRFTNKAGSGMVVIRSMEVTKKKSTMTFKALDGVLRTMNKDTGERVSLSQKCSDLDKQIPTMLGVSKAILDYVLFVHQEDSSWPLQEAAILKKRFDDIFDSTRYSKALESFRKTKKDLTSQLKDIKAELSGLSSHKHAAKGFREEREKQNQNLEDLEEEISQAKKAIADAKEEEQKWFDIVSQVEVISEKIQAKQNELKNLRSVSNKQRSMLEKDLTRDHDINKLKEMLKDFDKEMRKQREREQALAQERKMILNEIEDLRQKELKLNSTKGKYAAEKEAHEKRQRERFLLMEKIAQTYSIELQQSLTQLSRLDASMMSMSQTSLLTGGGTQETTPPELTKEDLDGFFAAVEKKEAELKENLRSHKATYRAQEEEFNSALQDLVGKRNAFENEQTKLSAESKNIDRELMDLSKLLGSKRIKKSAIDEFREKAKEYAKDLEKLTKNDKRQQLTTQIRSHNDRIEKIDEDINSKTNIRKKLQNSANLKNQIDLLRQQRLKDVKKLQELFESQTETLRSVDIEVPATFPEESEILTFFQGILGSLSTKCQEASEKVKNAAKQESAARSQLAESQSTLQLLNDSNKNLETNKDKLQNTVSKIKKLVKTIREDEQGYEMNWTVEADEPKELLDFLDGTLKEMEDNSPDDFQPQVVARLLKRIKKLTGKEKKKSKCPCCDRSMSDDERKVFSERIKALADPDESPIIASGEEIQEFRQTKAKIEGWRNTVYSCMQELQEYRRILSELNELNPKITGFEERTRTSTKELAKLESSVVDLKNEESKLSGLRNACKAWSTEASRIEEQSDNISRKSELLHVETSEGLGEASLEEVDEEIQTLRDEKDSLYDKINRSQKDVTAINEEITNASSKLNKTQELLRQKEEKFAEEQQASEKKQNLEERKNVIGQEVTKLGEQIASLNQKIKVKEGEKGRLYSHANDEELKLNDTLNHFLSESKHLRDVTKLIEEYTKSKDNNGLDRIAAEVTKIVAKMKAKKQELAALQPEFENAVQAVNDQERHKKLLNENIDLLTGEERMQEIDKEIADIEKELEGISGHEEAEDRLYEIKERANKSHEKIARLGGRRSEIVEQIRGLNRKLQSEEYKDVDEKYRAEKIKFDTTEEAIRDLDSYANALDKALLRFHSIKIAEINKIIKELWTLCYKGEDISSIELESGQESRAAKSYNYRVVMTKGHNKPTKMDMRGRCSAGQRVLASIVIRLALAETFGICCGCLVLDEPTVNLDENNKRGLAVALARIIATRSKQTNFQLTLITHDESFVSMMKDELSSTSISMPEKYFHVRREDDGQGNFFSKIDACDWDEIM